jgi:hypothetical protein
MNSGNVKGFTQVWEARLNFRIICYGNEDTSRRGNIFEPCLVT